MPVSKDKAIEARNNLVDGIKVLNEYLDVRHTYEEPDAEIINNALWALRYSRDLLAEAIWGEE